MVILNAMFPQPIGSVEPPLLRSAAQAAAGGAQLLAIRRFSFAGTLTAARS
jgi:hypothetical protein